LHDLEEHVFEIGAADLQVFRRAARLAQCRQDALDLERVVRLSSVAKALSDFPLRQATLGVMKSLTGSDPAAEQELALLDERVARVEQLMGRRTARHETQRHDQQDR